jgi:hypothetical protein
MKQRDFFTKTDCELGEVYKLATKMAHLGGGWFGRRSCRSKVWKSYTDALKDSNVKIGEEDD